MKRPTRVALGMALLLLAALGLFLVSAPPNEPAPRTRIRRSIASPPRRIKTPAPEPPPEPVATAALVADVRSWAGEPIAGARVEVAPHTPYFPSHESDYAVATPVGGAETSADGVARVAGLDLDAAFRAIVAADGYASVERVFDTPTEPGDVRVAVRLARGLTLTGRVLDPSGAPVADAIVRVDQGTAFRATSNSDGRYVLARLPPGEHSLHAGRAGARPLEVARVRLPFASDFDILLAPLARLAGTVRDRDTREPLAGVEVTAGIWFGYRGRGTAVSGADGHYAIDTLPEGVVNSFSARLDGYRGVPVPSGPRALQIALRAGETTLHDHELFPSSDAPTPEAAKPSWPPGGHVSGRVLDTGGRPIAGVRIGLVRTDDEGHFLLELRDPGSNVSCPIDHPGFAGAELRATVPPAGEVLEYDVTLTRAPVIRGVVRMADGSAPPEGSAVSVWVVTGRQNPGPRGGREIKSRADVLVAPDGAYEAYVPWMGGDAFVEPKAPGLPRQRAREVAIEAGVSEYEVDLVLEAGGTVSGTVLDDVTGLPVAGARILAGAPTTTLAVTDEHGRFVAEGVPVGSIGPQGVPGRWAPFSIESANHLPWSGSIEQPDPDDLVVQLQPVLEIRGRATWADGRPAPSVRVYIDRHWIVAVTDHGGAFVLRRVTPGNHAIHVEGAAPGMDVRSDVVADVPAGAHDVRIVVQRGAKISGRVLHPNGAGVPDVAVSATPAGKRAPAYQAKTNGQGLFVVTGLPPGTFDLVARPNEMSPYTDAGRTHLPAYRAGVPADTEGVELVLGGGESVSGVLVDESGKPYPNVWLRVGGRSAVTDEAGRFRFDGLPLGTYRVAVQRATGGPVTIEGGEDVAAGAADLRLVGRAGADQDGLVLGPDGAPFAGAVIVVEGDRGVLARKTTGPDGRFVFPGLPRAAVAFAATARGLVPARVEVDAPGTASVTLRLERGLEATGRLLDESGEPLGAVWISLDHPEQPHLRVETRTDADGRFRTTGLIDAEYSASMRVDRDGRMTRVGVGTLRPGADAELRLR